MAKNTISALCRVCKSTCKNLYKAHDRSQVAPTCYYLRTMQDPAGENTKEKEKGEGTIDDKV